MTYVNLTPHAINLNDGRVFPPSGTVARVSTSYTEFENDISRIQYGEVTDLPSPQPETIYIVSVLVAQATNRQDVVSPATGHPECVRNDKGHIVSVPGFVR